ncbi:MAG TPA: hypothetical protein VGC49_08235 [Solirubrobacterales bacterium]|jgi:hypothetical protein
MKRLRRLALAMLCLAAAMAGPVASSAFAGPLWHLELHHEETHFAPGGTGAFWVEVSNIGDTNTYEPFSVTIDLPPGLTREEVRQGGYEPWDCPGSPGDTTITCTISNVLQRHWFITGKIFSVNVDPSASGVLTATATIEGGGAPKPYSTTESVEISSDPAPFGVTPGGFYVDFLKDGEETPVRQSGEHPDLAAFNFDFNTIANTSPEGPRQKAPNENVRDLEVTLPPGFVGNPTAVGECTPAELSDGACPRSSQVGRIEMTLFPVQVNPGAEFGVAHYPVFNMVHPRGAVADLAFSVVGNPVHIKASLDAAHDYAIKTTVSDINESLPVFAQKLTLWGTPADHSHDWDRCTFFGGLNVLPEEVLTTYPCPTNTPLKPFLTIPSQCDASHSSTIGHMDSWEHKGVFAPEQNYPSPPAEGCDKPRFEPDVSVHPTAKAANSPTGLDVHVLVPQNESANGLAAPPVKRMEVTFPEGMTVSPSFADGLTGCSSEQIGLGTNDLVACPDSSRIGTVDLSTPLLPEPLSGSIYLSKQKENPFGTTFGMYLVVHDEEERGVLVKIPGRLELDPTTGQIATIFDDVPQFPVEEFTLGFRSGPRAPLVTPQTCGKQTIGVEVTSWAQPDSPVDVSNDIDVTEGPGGSPCPASLKDRPFGPKLEAGSVNPTAGNYSSFLFRVNRGDQDQEFNQIEARLPKGLLAKIAGVAECPDAALASISSAEESGRDELANPACPASSQIGTVEVGMGAGTGPNFFAGRTYLAGPYKGAPLSLAVVVPALAGPFDLGSVAVRAAIHVDPEDAQVHVVSDPLPTILHGVLLRVRDVRVKMDRPESMINPTSCDPTSVDSRLTGTGEGDGSSADNAVAELSNRFQLASCASLGFKPHLNLKLKGGTNRGDYPALTAVLKARKGDANIGRAAVTLPHSEFLAQNHIRTVCTRVQFAAHECPAGSIYGFAKATSPLLEAPLEGPVYLRSSDNPLPDLVASLDGRVHVDLVGRIDSINGGIRTTFAHVPDAAVSRFTLRMKGGKKGLLVNSRNLCGDVSRADVRFRGHNGKVSRSAPKVSDRC